MRNSRTREVRGGSRRPLILSLLLILVVVAGVGVAYFVQGFGPLAARTAPVEEPQALVRETVQVQEPAMPAGEQPPTGESSSLELSPQPTATPEPTQAPEPVSETITEAAPAVETPPQVPVVIPEAAPELSLEEKRAAALKLLPDVEFGEVLGEGFGALKLPGGELVDTWYTFQVDTRTGEITVYMAQFDADLESILTTMKVVNYAKGKELDNAEMTLYYSDGSERVISFNGPEGTIRLVQHYNLPFGPSVFSAPLRRELVFYGMEFTDQAGETSVELHLDVSGLADSEEMEFEKKAPVEVIGALHEIRLLVDQIEEQRQG